jgi:rubrerythrin
MKLNTASQVISYARQLEEEGAGFYESAAKRYTENSDELLVLARENRKNIIRVERAYYSAITDAIEGCFTFDIDPDEYAGRASDLQNQTYGDSIKAAIEMEGKTIRFYEKAAEQSKSLLADVPRILTAMATLRNERREKLGAIHP